MECGCLEDQAIILTRPSTSPQRCAAMKAIISNAKNASSTVVLNISIDTGNLDSSPNETGCKCMRSIRTEYLGNALKEGECNREDENGRGILCDSTNKPPSSVMPINECNYLNISPSASTHAYKRSHGPCDLANVPEASPKKSHSLENISKPSIQEPYCLENLPKESQYSPAASVEVLIQENAGKVIEGPHSCSESAPKESIHHSKHGKGSFWPGSMSKLSLRRSKRLESLSRGRLRRSKHVEGSGCQDIQGHRIAEESVRNNKQSGNLCSWNHDSDDSQCRSPPVNSCCLENPPEGPVCASKPTRRLHASGKSRRSTKNTVESCSSQSEADRLKLAAKLTDSCCLDNEAEDSQCSLKQMTDSSLGNTPKESSRSSKNRRECCILENTHKQSLNDCENAERRFCSTNPAQKSVRPSKRSAESCCLERNPIESPCSVKHTVESCCVDNALRQRTLVSSKGTNSKNTVAWLYQGCKPTSPSCGSKHPAGSCCFESRTRKFNEREGGTSKYSFLKEKNGSTPLISRSSRHSSRSACLESAPSCSPRGGSCCQSKEPKLSLRKSMCFEESCQGNTPKSSVPRDSMRCSKGCAELCHQEASPKKSSISGYTVENDGLRNSTDCRNAKCESEPSIASVCLGNVFGTSTCIPKHSGGSCERKTRSICASNESADVICHRRPSRFSIQLSGKPLRNESSHTCCVAPETMRNSLTQCSQKTSVNLPDSNLQAKIASLLQQRESVHSRSPRVRGINKAYQKLDAAAKYQANRTCTKPAVNLYACSTSRPSFYSRSYNDTCETPWQRSFKITPAAKEDICVLHGLINCFFDKLVAAFEALGKCDFGFCDEMVSLICQIQGTIARLIEHLRYGAYKNDLYEINERLLIMIDELMISPHFVLLRLVEFGFNIYDLGSHLRMELLPCSFAQIVHKVQNRIYRIKTGRIIRQIYFVPNNMDPVIGTYFKSRRLIKLEHFCHCNIVLLPPHDPRSIYCPVNYRTIEVNFDIRRGRYVGFQQLLNQSVPEKGGVRPRLVASVFKRLCGAEVEISLGDLCNMETTEPRITYNTVKGDIVSGTGLAIAPKIEI